MSSEARSFLLNSHRLSSLSSSLSVSLSLSLALSLSQFTPDKPSSHVYCLVDPQQIKPNFVHVYEMMEYLMSSFLLALLAP